MKSWDKLVILTKCAGIAKQNDYTKLTQDCFFIYEALF